MGKKIGMTQIFLQDGVQVPVTVVEIEPSVVTQIKTKGVDGYNALQLAYGVQADRKVKKPSRGLFDKIKVAPRKYRYEIRTDEVEGVSVGAEVGIENFSTDDYVDVSGVSIGKGFQGVVKRHRFAGGPKSHGAMFGREPGSIGQSSYPSRVFKGMKAPGRMGNKMVTVQNLKIVKVDTENNLVLILGAIPGASNSIVVITLALKKGTVEKPLQVREIKKTTEVSVAESDSSADATEERASKESAESQESAVADEPSASADQEEKQE